VLVPLVALFELVAHFHFASAAPEPERWQALHEPVGALHQKGDLLVVAPYWAEPNARAVFGDSLMPLADVARPDELAHPRIIELSILGQSAGIEGLRLLDEQRHGPFRIRVLHNERYQPELVDFVDRVAAGQASAFSRRGQRGSACPWDPKARVSTGTPALHGHPAFPPERFQCGKTDWHFVGVTVIEDEHYRPRRCIWAHPADRATTVVRFDKVQLGSKIIGHGGISWFLERESKGTPVELQVLVDDDKLGEFQHVDGDGWSRFEFATSQYEGGEHSVEFQVQSKRSHQREFCFAASVFR
jgi:hypothetical protein